MPYSEKRPPFSPVALHAESLLRSDGSRIEMRLWRGVRGPVCRVEYLHRGEVLLSFAGDRQVCERTLRGRATPYLFRSIEQLRYDFERDLEEIADGDETPA